MTKAVKGFYKNSGIELRNALAYCGKRPRDLAQILGVTDQQVNNILTGKAKIPARHLWAIAEVCNYSYELLIEAVINDERVKLNQAANKAKS